MRVLLLARVVLPIITPPIDNGAVLICGAKIAAVGTARTLRRQPHDAEFDLGAVILMPGLVNAHCHLDYTDMAGQVEPSQSFTDWIQAVLALKARRTYSDYAVSWLQGARMLLNHGVTTVADVEAVPELLPEVRSATPLRVCSLLEMTGVRGRRPPNEILRTACNKIQTLGVSVGWAGLSPHAPYSTSPELLRLSAEVARQRHWRVATHVAESAEEFEMYTARRGRLFEWLEAGRDMSDCGQGSPVQYLHRQGLVAENFMGIHANYLAPGDADLLGKAGASVVHCPRSHAYFAHDRFPFDELAAAGVNLCLGTDSLASVRVDSDEPIELDLFAEMRALAARQRPELPPETLVRLVTVNGARALGMAGQLGELSPGASADCAVIPFSGRKAGAWRAVVRHHGPVSGVMMDGRWVIEPSRA